MARKLDYAQQQYRNLYYTPNEACRLLGVCRRTLERYVSQGKLRRFKQSRYTLYLKTQVQSLFARSAIHEEGKEHEFGEHIKALSLRYAREKKATRPEI